MITKLKIKDKQHSFEREALPHYRELYRTSIRLTKNKLDAEDLVQDTLAKALRFWDKYEPNSNCKAWLFKIMINMFYNRYRAKSRSPVFVNIDDIDDNIEYNNSKVSKDYSPERIFMVKLLGNDIKQAIVNLRTEFRTVTILALLEGYSYREIAHFTNVHLSTVKSRLNRSRKILRKKLFEHKLCLRN